ncbi:hypothetical protein NLI96_g717 [Meripilus lineatus]|uniref:Uncharacterized protein n=1 Tax=Meripilus lineatus TaxID=2056292 RepID=A0AAD5YJ24_9APHY|nr:hypothetical protein NLI96_g717 [Physisporinus lineatus]
MLTNCPLTYRSDSDDSTVESTSEKADIRSRDINEDVSEPLSPSMPDTSGYQFKSQESEIDIIRPGVRSSVGADLCERMRMVPVMPQAKATAAIYSIDNLTFPLLDSEFDQTRLEEILFDMPIPKVNRYYRNREPAEIWFNKFRQGPTPPSTKYPFSKTYSMLGSPSLGKSDQSIVRMR